MTQAASSTARDVFASLTAEAAELEDLVAGLGADGWARPTPAPGWTVAHQIAHLAFVSHLAAASAREAEGFEEAGEFEELIASSRVDFQAAIDAALDEYLADPPEKLFERWRTEVATAAEALAALPPGAMVPWLTGPLPAPVLAAAGLMEHFAHGQDIADALGVRREPTARLRHIAGFAARTRDFGYLARGLRPPAEEFVVELTGPAGDLWRFGPADAAQRITGPALDFCLLATRRRHRDDLALTAIGEEADRWLDIAQCYRGPSGDGRRAGQFAHDSAAVGTTAAEGGIR